MAHDFWCSVVRLTQRARAGRGVREGEGVCRERRIGEEGRDASFSHFYAVHSQWRAMIFAQNYGW